MSRRDGVLQEGSLVKWSPPTVAIAESVELQSDHPGVVASLGPRHVLLNWVNRDTRSVPYQSAFDPEWLTVIDEDEYARLRDLIHEIEE